MQKLCYFVGDMLIINLALKFPSKILRVKSVISQLFQFLWELQPTTFKKDLEAWMVKFSFVPTVQT